VRKWGDRMTALTTRRAFLRGAALGAWTLPIWSLSVLAEPPSVFRPAGLLEFDRIIFDARRPHALAFGEAAHLLGARTHATWGDVDDRWYEDLYRRWRTRKTPAAGITDFRSLFLVQMMAADVGLRLVLRIHHGLRGAPAAHEAFGAHMYRAMSNARLAGSGRYWSREAARLVLNLPERGAAETRYIGNLNEANLRTIDSNALVTWVIA
jgi:hypothetical protein